MKCLVWLVTQKQMWLVITWLFPQLMVGFFNHGQFQNSFHIQLFGGTTFCGCTLTRPDSHFVCYHSIIFWIIDVYKISNQHCIFNNGLIEIYVTTATVDSLLSVGSAIVTDGVCHAVDGVRVSRWYTTWWVQWCGREAADYLGTWPPWTAGYLQQQSGDFCSEM